MSTDNNNQSTESKKLEITSDNILHCLMHAATREDIAELKTETKNSINDLRAETKANISDLKLELKTDMAELKSDLRSEMNVIKSDLKSEMQALRKDTNKYFRWIVGLMFGSFGGIAIMILKFPMLTH